MIIDSFLFNKDFASLEIRLSELSEIVDLFVICESNFTFSGKSKPLYLTENIDNFSAYSHKIKVIIEENKHKTKIPMIREIHQRKRITKYLKTLSLTKNDLIIYSDCDEIPRSSVIEKLNKKNKCNALLELQGYSNYLNMKGDIWPRARVISGDKFKSIED
jgi:beta-1,4-mannosyl-glycoprotein beta-1,4-N-acetylglucosaminyltransferase